MKAKVEMLLAETRIGRVVLHLAGMAGGHLGYHARGIWHEVRLQGAGRLSHAGAH